MRHADPCSRSGCRREAPPPWRRRPSNTCSWLLAATGSELSGPGRSQAARGQHHGRITRLLLRSVLHKALLHQSTLCSRCSRLSRSGRTLEGAPPRSRRSSRSASGPETAGAEQAACCGDVPGWRPQRPPGRGSRRCRARRPRLHPRAAAGPGGGRGCAARLEIAALTSRTLCEATLKR